MPEVTVAEVTVAEVTVPDIVVAEVVVAEAAVAVMTVAEVTVAEVIVAKVVVAAVTVVEATFQDCRVAAPLAQVVGRQGDVVGSRPPRAQEGHKHKHSQCARHPSHHTNMWSDSKPCK